VRFCSRNRAECLSLLSEMEVASVASLQHGRSQVCLNLNASSVSERYHNELRLEERADS
jgi:hypothetical protein